jgi:hypothetical protein
LGDSDLLKGDCPPKKGCRAARIDLFRQSLA